MKKFPLNQSWWKKTLPNSVLYWIIMVEENLKNIPVKGKSPPSPCLVKLYQVQEGQSYSKYVLGPISNRMDWHSFFKNKLKITRGSHLPFTSFLSRMTFSTFFFP